MRHAISALCISGFLALSSAAHASDLIVAQARGIGYAPGSKIDSSHVINLREGQHLTLITPNGDTINLNGPFTGTPQSGGGGGGIMTALAALTGGGRRYGEVGTTRGTPDASKLPAPWLLDVSHSGKVCLLEGTQPVLWRPARNAPTDMNIAPADQSWKASLSWPANADRLPFLHPIELHDGVTYLVDDKGNQTAISLDFVPANLPTDEARAAYMIARGCNAQAVALVHPAK